MKHILLCLITLAAVRAGAAETEATAVEPVTKEQQRTHESVEKKQKILKKKLIEKAPPEEIGKAKAAVQKDRAKANAADAKANIDTEQK